MKILLSASWKHYDFYNDNVIIKHSVGILCQLFSNVLREFGEVEYINDTDMVKGKEYDLIVSWPRNFDYLTKYNKYKKSVCFMNIAESSYLKRVMREEANRLGCKVSDCFTPVNYYHADLNFLIGNHHVINQYVAAGIPRNKIVNVFYRHNTIPFKKRSKNKRTVFLHVATTLGLRKGFWHVVNDFKNANLDAELWCVGKVQKERFWYEFEAEAKKDPRIKVFGWIPCDSPDYFDKLNRADFMMFPSFGEGQPGTIIEALEGGCIPISSVESGFDYHPLRIYERGDASIYREAHEMSDAVFMENQLQGLGILETKYNNDIFKQTIRDNIKSLMQI